MKDYWNWYFSYHQFELIGEGLQLAQKRYKAISFQTVLGDKASIDSVEAAIIVQDRMIQFEKMKIELLNARLTLSNHLWTEEGRPLELPDFAIPPVAAQVKDDAQAQLLDSLLATLEISHPDLLKLRTKGDQLSIERRYRLIC